MFISQMLCFSFNECVLIGIALHVFIQNFCHFVTVFCCECWQVSCITAQAGNGAIS